MPEVTSSQTVVVQKYTKSFWSAVNEAKRTQSYSPPGLGWYVEKVVYFQDEAEVTWRRPIRASLHD